MTLATICGGYLGLGCVWVVGVIMVPLVMIGVIVWGWPRKK